MGTIRKLRDTPEWSQIRDQLRKVGFDPNAVAILGESEGDSLDHVETIIAFEGSFNIKFKFESLSKEDSLK
jgi:acyl carrier protein